MQGLPVLAAVQTKASLSCAYALVLMKGASKALSSNRPFSSTLWCFAMRLRSVLARVPCLLCFFMVDRDSSDSAIVVEKTKRG